MSGTSFPPASTPTVTKALPCVIYEQYSDDDSLQAFAKSYNDLVQEYIDFFNTIGLPIYTGSMITGALLDWVGRGIYGYPRPAFATPPVAVGELAQLVMAEDAEMAGALLVSPGTPYIATDDQYKRCLTWHVFKGDGKNFSIKWLKRRVQRFLNGVNGATPVIDQTYQVSIKPASRFMNIVISTGGTNPIVPFLVAALNAGVLALPFEYDFVAQGN